MKYLGGNRSGMSSSLDTSSTNWASCSAALSSALGMESCPLTLLSFLSSFDLPVTKAT